MSIGKLNKLGMISRDTPLAIDREEKLKEGRVARELAKTPSEPPKDDRVYGAAKMYEKYFLGEMVKAMRSTVSEGGLVQSGMADRIYKDQLDDQYVTQWTDSGGVGLSDMIYDDLMTKFINPQRPDKAQGPIALTDRDVSRVQKAPSALPNQTALRVELKGAQNGDSPAKVQAPWDAKVLTTTKVDGKTTVLLEHEGGIRSALIFDGVSSNLRPGQALKRGEAIGVLNPTAKSFFWNLSGRLQNAQTAQNTISPDQEKSAGPEAKP